MMNFQSRLHTDDESLSLKLIEIGISKELLQVERPEFQQQAMDILVILLGQGDTPNAMYILMINLVSDKCMEALFEDGEVLRVAKGWLEGTAQLRMANAALIIANLARSGKEHTTMVYVCIRECNSPFGTPIVIDLCSYGLVVLMTTLGNSSNFTMSKIQGSIFQKLS